MLKRRLELRSTIKILLEQYKILLKIKPMLLNLFGEPVLIIEMTV